MFRRTGIFIGAVLGVLIGSWIHGGNMAMDVQFLSGAGTALFVHWLGEKLFKHT